MQTSTDSRTPMRVWCVAVRWGVGLVGAVLVPVWASAQPILSVTPTAVDLQASVGTNPPSQTVTVSNAGSRALKWSVVPPSVNWVSVAPTSGVNTGTVTLTFNMAGLAAAQYQTSFTVTSTTGSSLVVSVRVTLVQSSPPPSKTLTGLTISGPSSVAVGQTAQYTAGAVYSDGSSQTLTGVWWYTYENSATIDHATGILTGVAAGPAYVRFDYAPGGTITSPPPYPVSIGKTVTGLSISGPSSVTVGQTAQYTATVVYSDGSSQPLTSGPGWSTSNSSFATITQSGVVTAVAAGSVTVQAAYGGFTAPYTVSTVAQPAGGSVTIYVSPTGVDTNPGTQSSPVRTIQRGVDLGNQANAAGQDALVSMAAGVYREAVMIGTVAGGKTLTLQGVGQSTVLTGTDDWSSGWTAQGDGSYAHVWYYGWGLRSLPAGWESYWNYDGNGYKRDVLRRYEMIYVNGQPLRAVLSRAELVDGTFYVDEAGDKLYLRLPTGVSLTGALVEVGLRPIVLTVTSRSNLTLRNFAVERNMGSLQDKAVWISKSSNIVLEGMYFRWNAYGGVGTAENTGLQIRGSVFSDNGVMGLGGNRDRNVLLEDSEIARNNWRGWPAEYKGWDAIHKWLEYRDAVVRRIRVVDNWGNGFYMDTDNQRITFQDSLVSGNQLNGLTVEMNGGPITISNNRICNNGFTGVADEQSNYVSLVGNQIFNNGVNGYYNILFTGTYSGRYVTDYETGITTLIRSQYWTVTDNTVAGSEWNQGNGGWLWVHSDYNAPGAWSIVRNSFVNFDRNHWYHSTRANAFYLPQGPVTYATFKSDLQLANSRFELNSTFQQSAPLLSCSMP